MSQSETFESVARLPAPGDNAAIALTDLTTGTTLTSDDSPITISSHVLEGHRFAITSITPGQSVTSWGIPFGRATRPIAPGDYLINQMMLDALSVRNVPFQLPTETNFEDCIPPIERNSSSQECLQATSDQQHFFEGFRRADSRGTGTRNHVIILATNALANNAVRRLAEAFRSTKQIPANVDGVVPVTHTEGATSKKPNNLELVLRSLTGFIEHPNVGGVLAVDANGGFINNHHLEERLGSDKRTANMRHVDFVASPRSDADFKTASDKLANLVQIASKTKRSRAPISELKIALQCGGSDAFSGVSGNPLAGEIAKRVVACGGFANLAETSELIGAESYILTNVRDSKTADKFLVTVARFQEWAGWHGHSAAGNPSGGNLYRGLYNIVIKSIGAGMKKHPDVRLDEVIEYGERMNNPGFHFMDSAGNDLESIAGQVASGCNLILFITGNGSITNFPFVPTIKIVTTTRRHELLRHEMDINAGRYLDGIPMSELAEESFAQVIRVASGERSAGERAGHSQVQLWRDWQQIDASRLPSITATQPPSGVPIEIAAAERPEEFPPIKSASIGLIAPTSLCSGQIALMIAEQLNRRGADDFSRFVALAHTEGCGVSRGVSEELFVRTMINHARHPLVRQCLFLEHGCEKTHNDEFRQHLRSLEIDPGRFGWAGIQSAGGIEAVTREVIDWFDGPANHSRQADWESHPILAFLQASDVDDESQIEIAEQCRSWVAAGGSVIVNANAVLLKSRTFADALGCSTDALDQTTLAHGERPRVPGFHVMDAPTDIAAETMTGLAASGADTILTVGEGPFPRHPFVPVLAWSPDAVASSLSPKDADETTNQFDIEFQITRGQLGVSL